MVRLRGYPVGYSNLGVDVPLVGSGRVVVFCHGGEEERCCGDEAKRLDLRKTRGYGFRVSVVIWITDEHVTRTWGHDLQGWAHLVTAGYGFWKEVDNGKGRRGAQRQEAQIAITPTSVLSLRVTGTWSVASPAIHI